MISECGGANADAFDFFLDIYEIRKHYVYKDGEKVDDSEEDDY